MSVKRWFRERELSPDEVVAAVAEAAAVLRTEAESRDAAASCMDDIAARLEVLLNRMQNDDA